MKTKEKFKQTEIGEIPEDWEVKRFEEVIDKNWRETRDTEPKSLYEKFGKYPIIDQSQSFISGYTNDESKVYRNCLPIIVFGDHTRVFKYIDFPFVVGADGTKLIKVNEKIYNTKFIYFAFKNINIPSRGYNRHFKLLKEQFLPLPPKQEQEKIVYVLSKIQKAIENQEKIIQYLKEMKSATMAKLFREGLYNKPLKKTEIGEIPEDWEVVCLGDIAHISSGGSSPQGLKFFGGQNPFIRVQHININGNILRWDLITDDAVGKYRLKKYPKGTIVFPKTGASIYLEKRAKLPVDAYIVSHLCAIELKDESINNDFLFFQLRNKRIAEKKADTYPTLNLSEIENILISLPPKQEQEKIVYVLSKIQKAIENQEKIIQYLKEMKSATMAKLFREGLYNKPLKKTEIGEIPEDWEVVKLGEVFNIFAGGDVMKLNFLPFKNEKYIYPIFSNSLENDGLYGFADTFSFPENSITVTGRGNLGYAIPRYCKFNAIIRLLVLVPKKSESINIKFFSEYINGFIRVSIEGSSIPQLTKPKISMYTIPLPPFPVQQKIAEILSAVDNKIQAEENKKKALQELFKSMLDQLMTGKIRLKDIEFKEKK